MGRKSHGQNVPFVRRNALVQIQPFILQDVRAKENKSMKPKQFLTRRKQRFERYNNGFFVHNPDGEALSARFYQGLAIRLGVTVSDHWKDGLRKTTANEVTVVQWKEVCVAFLYLDPTKQHLIDYLDAMDAKYVHNEASVLLADLVALHESRTLDLSLNIQDQKNEIHVFVQQRRVIEEDQLAEARLLEENNQDEHRDGLLLDDNRDQDEQRDDEQQPLLVHEDQDEQGDDEQQPLLAEEDDDDRILQGDDDLPHADNEEEEDDDDVPMLQVDDDVQPPNNHDAGEEAHRIEDANNQAPAIAPRLNNHNVPDGPNDEQEPNPDPQIPPPPPANVAILARLGNNRMGGPGDEQEPIPDPQIPPPPPVNVENLASNNHLIGTQVNITVNFHLIGKQVGALIVICCILLLHNGFDNSYSSTPNISVCNNSVFRDRQPHISFTNEHTKPSTASVDSNVPVLPLDIETSVLPPSCLEPNSDFTATVLHIDSETSVSSPSRLEPTAEPPVFSSVAVLQLGGEPSDVIVPVDSSVAVVQFDGSDVTPGFASHLAIEPTAVVESTAVSTAVTVDSVLENQIQQLSGPLLPAIDSYSVLQLDGKPSDGILSVDSTAAVLENQFQHLLYLPTATDSYPGTTPCSFAWQQKVVGFGCLALGAIIVFLSFKIVTLKKKYTALKKRHKESEKGYFMKFLGLILQRKKAEEERDHTEKKLDHTEKERDNAVRKLDHTEKKLDTAEKEGGDARTKVKFLVDMVNQERRQHAEDLAAAYSGGIAKGHGEIYV